jgi:spore germination cell wall hydrolase CwlJ-like protein
MPGLAPYLRRLSFSAALTIATLPALVLPASADPAASGAARALGQEQAGLAAKGAERLSKMSAALKPRPRSDADVTVASRSIDPGTTAELIAAAKSVAATRLDFGMLDALPATKLDKQTACLAQAIYFESRGEPLAGQIAVAEVVLNRVDSPAFPDTVCAVTRQGAGTGRGCQFSYVCDRYSDVMRSPVQRARAEKLAALMMQGRARTATDGALYFHTRAVRTGWSKRMTRTAAIGHHQFYRPAGAPAPTQLAGL